RAAGPSARPGTEPRICRPGGRAVSAAAPRPGRPGAATGRRAEAGGLHRGGDRGPAGAGAADGAASPPADPADVGTGVATMSDPACPDHAALTLSAARRVDAIAYRFEKAWKAVTASEQRPRLADYLAGVPESERPALLAELVALDIEYRRR